MTPRFRVAAVVAVCIVVVAGLLVALSVPIGGQPSPSVLVIGGSPLLGKAAPDIALQDLDGNTVRLSELRGKPVVLNFWASWCIPCRDEFPQFVAARGEHVADELQIVGVVHNDVAGSARDFAATQGALWPMLMDPANTAWDAYGGVGVPMTFFIDRDGIVRAASLGPVTAAGLKQQLATIL